MFVGDFPVQLLQRSVIVIQESWRAEFSGVQILGGVFGSALNTSRKHFLDEFLVVCLRDGADDLSRDELVFGPNLTDFFCLARILH